MVFNTSFTFYTYSITIEVSFSFLTILFASVFLSGMDWNNLFSNTSGLQEFSFIFSIIKHFDIYLEIVVNVFAVTD
jgi:hypothetical protein